MLDSIADHVAKVPHRRRQSAHVDEGILPEQPTSKLRETYGGHGIGRVLGCCDGFSEGLDTRCAARAPPGKAPIRCVLPPHMAILECSMHARESKKTDNLCTRAVSASAPPRCKRRSGCGSPRASLAAKRPTPLVCASRNTAIPIAQPPIAYRATPNARATCTYSFMAPPPVRKKRDITCV